MILLEAIKIDKAFTDRVLNDPGFRVGFEVEVNLVNAVDFLNGERLNPRGDELNKQQRVILDGVRSLVAEYLSIDLDSIVITDKENRDLTRWNLDVDTSIHDADGYDDHRDLGVELISPVMPLRDGLRSLYQVRDMIAEGRDGRVHFETTESTGFHINLSHTKMKKQKLDFVKLAFLFDDTYYLKEFDREANEYSRPVLHAMLASIQAEYENLRDPDRAGMARFLKKSPIDDLLQLKSNWSVSKVFKALSDKIPKDHHSSVDLSRLDSANPYVEFRVAGNIGYEDDMDMIARMVLSFAALIEVSLDPAAYRREYLTAVYKALSQIVGTRKPERNVVLNKMNAVRTYLKPIMTPSVRNMLGMFERTMSSNKRLSESDKFKLLYLVRIIFNAQAGSNQYVVRGFRMLMELTSMTGGELSKMLRYLQVLYAHSILSPTEDAKPFLLWAQRWLNAL